MTGLARKVIDSLLSEDLQGQAASALASRGLGDICDPDVFTGFIAWPTHAGTCTLIHSPAAMLLIAEERGKQPRLVGAAPYDSKAIAARNWAVFDAAPVAA